MKSRLWLLLIVAACERSGVTAAPSQPLPYSHRTHVAFGLTCRDCHRNPDPGDRMEFPLTTKCMSCHATLAQDKLAIQKLAAFNKAKEPVPWMRVFALPAGVYWNHRSHLEASITCESCHGAVTQMDVMENRTNVTTMAGCLDCHRQTKAGTGCEFCHEGK